MSSEYAWQYATSGGTSLAQLLVQAEAGGDRGIAGAMFLHDLRDDVRHALL
ncbi:hypothetical protein [Xanthomonas oryzae]|uniref:hypothetical protein n=1 Tax=Xanthomonas oryzae TaxID=347 RepID=UPI00338F405A